MTILPSLSARREIRHAFFVAMEIAWIATLTDFLDAVIGGPARPATAWCLWLYPATYLYAHFEQASDPRPLVRLGLRFGLGATVGLATLCWIAWPVFPRLTGASGDNWLLLVMAIAKLGVGPVIVAAFACAFAMARGWLLGPRRIDGDGFLAAFQTGVVVLFAVAFLRHVAGLPAAGTLTGATLFLAFGLYGLWLCRWLDSDLATRSVGRAGWPVLAAAIVGLVLAAGIAFGTRIDHTVIDWLLTPVFWLLNGLGLLLRFLLDLLPDWEPSRAPSFLPPKPPTPTVRHAPYRFGEISHAIGAVMFSTAMIGLLAMIILRNLGDLLRWLSRWSGRSPGIAHEASGFSFLDDIRAIAAALKAAARRLFAWLTGRWRHVPGLPSAEVRAVRGVYARLLLWAARRGWPRPAGQTPYEYLDLLRGVVPHLEAELATITEAYVAVRYGDAMPRPEQIIAVKDGWRRIRRTRKKRARTGKEDPSCAPHPFPPSPPPRPKT